MNAFAKAMFEQLRHPDREVQFHMRVVDGPEMDCSCRDFLHLRPEEQALIRNCLGDRQELRVLDIACGIGRHSAFVHSLSPHAAITLVETNRQLREYCLARLPDAIGYGGFDDVPAHSHFDIAFLMGNGLGVFGDEAATRHQLQRVLSLLRIDGEPMAVRAAPALEEAGALEVVCVGGDLEALRALGLVALDDAYPDAGPLGGALEGMAWAHEQVTVITPCDPGCSSARPSPNSSTRSCPPMLAAVPVVDGQWRPLPIALRAAASPVLSEAFAEGERAVHRAIERLPFVALDVGPLTDADTPEDLPDRR